MRPLYFQKLANDLVNKTFVNETHVGNLRRDTETYDTETSSTVTTSVGYSFRGAFVAYRTHQNMFEEGSAGDLKCVIPYTNASFEPQTNDIVEFDGNDWRVVETKKDPTLKAVYTVLLRRIDG